MGKNQIMRNITDSFTDYLVQILKTPITKELKHEAIRAIVDYIGVLHAGKELLGVQANKLVNQFTALDLKGSQVLGFDKRTSPESAAFLNGYISHVAELDDGVNSGIVHPGTPVLSSLLPLAESRNVSEEQLIRGIIVGYEATIRLANAIQPDHKKLGYHATGTVGAIGAAAGICAMFGATDEVFKASISIAALSASGSLKALENGSQMKPFNVGNAAKNGVIAFLVAETGLNVPDDVFSGELGFIKKFTKTFNIDKLIPSNSGYAIFDIYIKPYAACRYCHPAIEASLKLTRKQKINLNEIDEILVETYDLAVRTHDHVIIPNISSAKMSIPFSVASSIYNGQGGIQAFNIESVRNHDIIALTGKVRVIGNDDYSKSFPKKSMASVTIKLHNGISLNELVEYPKGEPENRLSDKELARKFNELANLGGMCDEKIKYVTNLLFDESLCLKQLLKNLNND